MLNSLSFNLVVMTKQIQVLTSVPLVKDTLFKYNFRELGEGVHSDL